MLKYTRIYWRYTHAHMLSPPPPPFSPSSSLSLSHTHTRPPALKIQTIHTPHTTRPFSFNNKTLSRHATLPHTIATKSHQLGATAPFMPTTVPMERVIALLSVLPNNPALLPAPPLCVVVSGMYRRGLTSVACSATPTPSARPSAGRFQRAPTQRTWWVFGWW